MQMLHAQLVFVFQLLQLFLWRVFVVFLVLLGSLDSIVRFLADKEDLSVGVVKILGLHLRGPCEATELFDDPACVSK